MPGIRVLVVTRNLPPLIGGMERLNLELIRAMAAEFEIAVCAPRGAADVLSNCRVEEVPLTPLRTFLSRSALVSRRIARQFEPQVVIAGSGLTAPAVWWAARASGAKTLAYVHGLDLVVDQPVYQAFWLPAIRRMDAVVANSVWTQQTAIQRGVAQSRTDVVYCGAPMPGAQSVTEGQGAEQLPNAPFILSVGRLLRRKGLPEFIEKGMPLLRRRLPNLQFVVIGGEAQHALRGNRDSELERIQAAVQRSGLRDSIHVLGVVDTATVIAAFRRAKAFVFPGINIPGDVEGFGAVAIEAASYGCPTVAFRVGGVPDAVRDGESGTLIEPGNYSAMATALEDAVTMPQQERDMHATTARAFAARFTWEEFGERLRVKVLTLAGRA